MVPSVQATNMWTDTPYEGIASEGGVVLKGGKNLRNFSSGLLKWVLTLRKT